MMTTKFSMGFNSVLKEARIVANSMFRDGLLLGEQFFRSQKKIYRSTPTPPPLRPISSKLTAY